MNSASILILVDSCATHNVIDINVAHSVGLLEQCINTTILVGSGNKVLRHTASFNIPGCINSDVFVIDAYLLDIGNDVDIVLGMPWLASLARVCCLGLHQHGAIVHPQRAPAQLPHHPSSPGANDGAHTPSALPMVHEARTSPPPSPHNATNMSQRA
jgi:hypothetical protein